MISLNDLRDCDENKVLTAKAENDGYVIGGTFISNEDAEKFLQSVGWSDHFVDIPECLKREADFLKYCNEAYKEVDEQNKKYEEAGEYDKKTYIPTDTAALKISFQNFGSSVYGKSYDRIHLTYHRREITIIHGMPNAPAVFTVYSKNGNVVDKQKTYKKAVISALNNLEKYY